MDFEGFCPIWSDFEGISVLGQAKSEDKFFCSHLKGKNVGAAWLGTVKDKINIYRLKIIKNFRKTFSRF